MIRPRAETYACNAPCPESPAISPPVNLLVWVLVLLLSAVLVAVPVCVLGATLTTDSQVKAAMVYTMAKFVDWPPDAFPDDNSPFTVCVLGKGPFGSSVEALKGRPVRNRKVLIKQVTKADEAEGCQILIIDESARRKVPVVLDRLRNRSVLTISDLPNFAESGGAVGFVEIDGSVRFEINLDAAQNSHVKISSQLLKLAKIVREGY